MRTAIILTEDIDRQCETFQEIGQCQISLWTLKWDPIRWKFDTAITLQAGHSEGSIGPKSPSLATIEISCQLLESSSSWVLGHKEWDSDHWGSLQFVILM